jgi:hypothetical protein
VRWNQPGKNSPKDKQKEDREKKTKRMNAKVGGKVRGKVENVPLGNHCRLLHCRHSNSHLRSESGKEGEERVEKSR